MNLSHWKNQMICLVLFLCCSHFAMAQRETPEVKKILREYAIPSQAMLVSRLQEVNQDIAQRGIVRYEPDNRLLLTGYAYHELYDWDLYFENLYMSYFGVSDYCFSNLKSFLNKQSLNGFISRTLIQPRERQMFKPFLAQIAELGSRQTGDYTWLEERADRGQRQIGAAFSQISYYEQLILAVDYWFRHCDFDQNGLAVWNSSDHSGMDNQISRAGGLDAFRYEGVDVNCYLYRELKALQNIALHLHKKEDAVRFGQRADLLADKINTLLWDETEGMYFDRDEYTGQRVKVKAVSAFTPLWAGIASERRAARLVKEHLLNPEEFWTPFPVAGYAQTEPDYAQGDIRDWGCNWRGTTWIPMNYMIMHGLMDYGYTQEAQTLAKKTFELVGLKNEVTREFYQGESGEGLGLKRFWGWSALAYMMPFECALAYDPSRLDDRQIEALGTRLFQIQFPEVKDAPVINTQLTLE